MDDLLADFLIETGESLQELELALLRLEQAPADRDTLASVFRLVHTIKGTSGFLGQPGLERLAHATENVLARLRDGALAVTPDLVGLVLSGLDRMREIVAHGPAAGRPGEDAKLAARLDAAAAGEAEQVARGRASGSGVARIGQTRRPGRGPAAAVGQTVRVDVDALDRLGCLAAELARTRNQLLQLAGTQDRHAQAIGAIAGPLHRLDRLTAQLQAEVAESRMQPVGAICKKLPRMVRDLAQDLGKSIELTLRGTDLQLEREVLDLLRDPVLHIVRNACDHGIESPADRRRAGKQETGRICLAAYRERGDTVLEIADDGCGLPVARIRAQAMARHLASEAELAAMSDAQLGEFIFPAGFSTAPAVTAISGRGVGLDVVRTNVERGGGIVELKSRVGRGTSFIIRIPPTRAGIGENPLHHPPARVAPGGPCRSG